MTRTLSRAGRTLVQLVAGGGLAALVAALANGLSPVVAAGVALLGTFLTTLAQNTLEAAGVVKPLFETPHTASPPTDWVSKRLDDERRSQP